jgi:hypothetical protein
LCWKTDYPWVVELEVSHAQTEALAFLASVYGEEAVAGGEHFPERAGCVHLQFSGEPQP